MAFNQQLSVFGQVAPATTGTAGQVLVSAGSSASSYWASAIPVSAYSAQFIASTTGLSVASNAAFGFGTDNFTVEFWMYITANPGSTASIVHGTASSAFIINFSSAGRIIVRSYGIVDLLTASTSVNLNAWNHIAVTRSGTTLTIWLNGASAGTVTNSTSFATTGFYIGREDSGVSSYYYNGYISNLRIVKGVAVYTGAFTPPTSPLGTAQAAGTNIAAVTPSQVSLLTCNGPGFKDSSPNTFTVTNIGNIIASQFAPFSSFSAISRSATQTQTILTSGSGTYYPPSGVAWLRIRMVGGGGGGGASFAAGSGTQTSSGTNTVFGDAQAYGGAGGWNSYFAPGGIGGAGTIGSFSGTVITGARGSAVGVAAVNYCGSGTGGSTPFGGAGAGSMNGAGYAASTNSGGGGGGGGGNASSSTSAGTGGGAGGYVEAYVSNPAASYAYTVGAGGAGGAAGVFAGGGGGSGIIIVEENYAVSATTSGVYSAEYLIVAGGAGGYGNWGGGGGAGGVVTGGTTFVAGTTYTMTVGAGGAAATDGVNSYINNLGVQAYGGGTGRGALGGNGSNGGSGGGAGGNQSGATTNGGSGISGQGSNGGGAIPNVNPGGGGGGGAAYPGVQSTGTVAGNGGSGILNTITGSSVTYAGGGGGGNGAGQTAGTGGAGGGGNGATATGASAVNGTAGTANLGGGGGGGSTNGGLGGAGGSGVIIISIPTANYTARTTGSPTVTTNGIYTVLKFTASGTYTA